MLCAMYVAVVCHCFEAQTRTKKKSINIVYWSRTNNHIQLTTKSFSMFACWQNGTAFVSLKEFQKNVHIKLKTTVSRD